MKRHNLLIILTDQQRKDSLGCYGHPCARTPHLDGLAAEGIRFERHYVANPICMPNRLSIATGQYPRNHGMWTNGLLLPMLPRTLADHLGGLGWQTASFGKIHFTPNQGNGFESRTRWQTMDDDAIRADCGPYAGFEHAEITLGHTNAIAHYGAWFRAKGGTSDMLRPDETGSRPMPRDLYHSAFVAERTSVFITTERDTDRPFFCVASFPDPHRPFDCPRECYDSVDPDGLPDPLGGPEDLATRPEHYRQKYRGTWHRKGFGKEEHLDGIDQTESLRRRRHTTAMVEEIDRGMGRILSALEDAGVADDTYVLFLSDHGEQLGDHGLWFKGPFPFENLINTPLLVRGPSLPRGIVNRHLVSDVDLVPTLCHLLDVKPLDGCNGVNQSICWLGGESVRDHCLVEYRNGYGDVDRAMAVLLKDDIKYMRYQDGEEECTDLIEDPEERMNACHHPQIPDLRSELLDRILQTGSRLPVQISLA